MDVSQKSKALRAKLNMSQQDLARELEVSLDTVNRWENGKTIPSKLAMKAIETMCTEHKIELEKQRNIVRRLFYVVWKEENC